MHFENSQCHILSLGRIKRWDEKYVREMWKIHLTEWTEIRGWEATFERVTSHLSRDSTRWAGRTQGEPVHGCSSYHRHGHQHHIKHADSYKNKYWALNMMLFLFFATETSSKMKNCFSGYFYLPTSSSSMCLQLGPDLALDNVALVTLSWCLLVSTHAMMNESQDHCKTQDFSSAPSSTLKTSIIFTSLTMAMVDVAPRWLFRSCFSL